jgi:4-hydroxy-tetrahydrodipicolinate synthase
MRSLYGTGVALVTPMLATGKVDFKSLGRLLKHTSSANYWVVSGTTAESATLNSNEKKQILDFVKSNNPKNLPIVCGLGGNNTQEVISELDELNYSGITAILSVSPYYNKPSQEGIFRHYSMIADKSRVPVLLYNVPGRTSSNLSDSTTIRLSKHSNIIGIKESSGNLEQCMRILNECHKDFMMISGDDLLTIPLMSVGGIGVISVLANAYPGLFRKMTDHALDGNFRKASVIQRKFAKIHPMMYEEGNPSGLKVILSQLKLVENELRLPMTRASNLLAGRIISEMSKIKKG